MYGVSTPFIIATIVLGVIAFYLYRGRLGEIEEKITFYLFREGLDKIEEEHDQEQREEEKRKSEFGRKFARINRIPALRRLIKWMYKEGWWYSAGLILIVSIGSFFRFWKLGAVSFNQDEGLYFLLSKSISQNILPILPSGLIYIRGSIFTYLTYLSTLLFGISESSIRLPSVIFGLLLIILVYFFGRDLFNKKVGILSSFLIAIDLFMIAFSREGRFYIQFAFFFILTVYLFFRVYEKNDNLQLPLALSIFFSLESQDLSIFLIFFFGLFLIFHNKKYLKKKSTYIILLSPFIIFTIYYYIKDFLFTFSTPTQKLNLIKKPILNLQTINLSPQNLNFSYYSNIFGLNYPIFIFIIILAIICLFLLRNFNKRENRNLLFITYPTLIYFVILSFFVGRSELRFIIHLIPLFLIISSFGIFIIIRNICNLIKNEKICLKKLSILLIIIILSYNLILGAQLSSYGYNIREEVKETKPLLNCYNLFVQKKFHAFQSVMTHQIKIDYRPAAEYVKNHKEENDIIITTDNFYNIYPYIKPDYNTNMHISSYLGYIINYKRYDLYTGTEIITDLDYMDKITSLNRPIWVIADGRFERHGDREVVEYIKNNFKQVYSTENYFGGLIHKHIDRNNVIIYYKK